jgi:hypothetical protein
VVMPSHHLLGFGTKGAIAKGRTLGAARNNTDVFRSIRHSSSASILHSSPSYSTRSTFGLQQTWQSSTYCWRLPMDTSTEVSFHWPQPAH